MCNPCPPGSACLAGSSEPLPCSPGTFAPSFGTAACTRCSAGSYQSQPNATGCEVCVEGSYCPEGVPSPLPCPKGRYSNATGLTTQSECHRSPPGSECWTGSLAPTPCSPGTYAASAGSAECARCPAGSYQGSANATACRLCELGNYCPAGAAAALPCPAGRFTDRAGTSASGQCGVCPPGSFCFAGAIAPISCSPGSHAAVSGSVLCTTCREGTYAKWAGQTQCDECAAGFLCPPGSSVPLEASCDWGKYLPEGVEYAGKESCVDCPPGSFCTGGASQPRLCNPGFYALAWGMHECSGCAGGSSQSAAGATACITCEAGAYCPAEASSPLPCPKGRYSNATGLSAATQCSQSPEGSHSTIGSLAPTPCSPGTYAASAGSAECARCPAGSYQGSANATACETCPLFSFCPLSSAQPIPCKSGYYGPAAGLGSEEECVVCPAGFWCNSGKTFACVRGAYNNATGAADQSFCLPCPIASITASDASPSIHECICDPGFYNDDLSGHGVHCATCPIGARCEASGASRLRLPLQPGYWRISNRSADVRRCPDGASAETGCVGTNGSHAAQCKDGLTGPYCRLCLEPSGNFFNEEEGACVGCANGAVPTQLIVMLVVGLLVLGRSWFLSWRYFQRQSSKQLLAQMHAWFHRLGLKNKFKILFSMFQVSTKVPTIYQVRLPQSVQELVQTFQVTIDVGIDGYISHRLQCLNLHGAHVSTLPVSTLPVEGHH